MPLYAIDFQKTQDLTLYIEAENFQAADDAALDAVHDIHDSEWSTDSPWVETIAKIDEAPAAATVYNARIGEWE